MMLISDSDFDLLNEVSLVSLELKRFGQELVTEFVTVFSLLSFSFCIDLRFNALNELIINNYHIDYELLN